MALPRCRQLDFTEIPVIDIGPLLQGENTPGVTDAIDRACCDVGFFYLVGHGISASLVANMLEAGTRFFKLDAPDKLSLGLDASMRGYLPMYYRSQIDQSFSGTSHQEGFWMGFEFLDGSRHPLEQSNRWPNSMPWLKKSMTAYHAAIEKLAGCLGQALGYAMGQDDDFYQRNFAGPTSRLKINHYPPQDNPQREDSIGVVPHSDSGAFTILWQDDNGGLEVRSRSGEWVGAPPLSGSFVVNIGDIMQYWSNGRFSSTKHRVVNRNGVDRYSIPYFVNPSADVEITALNGESSFEPFNYGAYQLQRWKDFFPVDIRD